MSKEDHVVIHITYLKGERETNKILSTHKDSFTDMSIDSLTKRVGEMLKEIKEEL